MKLCNLVMLHSKKKQSMMRWIQLWKIIHGFASCRTCLYVDDMLIFGTDQDQVNKMKEFLSSNFSMKDIGETDVILGLRIKREDKVNIPLNLTIKLIPNTCSAVDQLEYSRAIAHYKWRDFREFCSISTKLGGSLDKRISPRLSASAIGMGLKSIQISNGETPNSLLAKVEAEFNVESSFLVIGAHSTQSSQDQKEYLPLCRAIVKGNWKEIQELLKQDGDAVTARLDINHYSSLHLAIDTGVHPDVVKGLLELIDDPNLLPDLVDRLGRNPLQYAALVGNTAAARILKISSSANEKDMTIPLKPGMVLCFSVVQLMKDFS
ncbi:zinc finger, CCHC-type containing protein, partial [Tanacetum coccineum]